MYSALKYLMVGVSVIAFANVAEAACEANGLRGWDETLRSFVVCANNQACVDYRQADGKPRVTCRSLKGSFVQIDGYKRESEVRSAQNSEVFDRNFSIVNAGVYELFTDGAVYVAPASLGLRNTFHEKSNGWSSVAKLGVAGDLFQGISTRSLRTGNRAWGDESMGTTTIAPNDTEVRVEDFRREGEVFNDYDSDKLPSPTMALLKQKQAQAEAKWASMKNARYPGCNPSKTVRRTSCSLGVYNPAQSYYIQTTKYFLSCTYSHVAKERGADGLDYEDRTHKKDYMSMTVIEGVCP